MTRIGSDPQRDRVNCNDPQARM